ncbi:hypothetical protein R6Q57_023677 [Mikania cordata]
MPHSSNQVLENKNDCSNFGCNRNNGVNRKVQFDINRPSPFTIASSLPPLLPDKRSYWKRVSFGKFSSQPIRLSILKLDGSVFDVTVMKKATVAKLKQAVEAAFNHMHRQGDCNISWSHVWGHFCLCFEHMKLLRDRDPVTRYGIKNGDQLQFVRHTPICTIAGETSTKLTYNQNESQGSSSLSNSCGNMKYKQNLVKNEVSEGYNKGFGASNKLQSSRKGLFSDRRQEASTKRNYHVVRLGQPVPCNDANTSGRRDASCGVDAFSSGTFSDYVGGFGYPTGYCLK